MSENDLITLAVGETELRFAVGTADYNRFMNEVTPTDKIGPAWNLLIGTVLDEDKEALRALCLRDRLPNGLVVMQLVGAIASEMGAEVSVVVKKPKR